MSNLTMVTHPIKCPDGIVRFIPMPLYEWKSLEWLTKRVNEAFREQIISDAWRAAQNDPYLERISEKFTYWLRIQIGAWMLRFFPWWACNISNDNDHKNSAKIQRNFDLKTSGDYPYIYKMYYKGHEIYFGQKHGHYIFEQTVLYGGDDDINTAVNDNEHLRLQG